MSVNQMPVTLMCAVLSVTVPILDRLIPCCALRPKKVVALTCGCECDGLNAKKFVRPNNSRSNVSVRLPRLRDKFVRVWDSVRNLLLVFHAVAPKAFGVNFWRISTNLAAMLSVLHSKIGSASVDCWLFGALASLNKIRAGWRRCPV